MQKLCEMLKERKKDRKIMLFFDIETFQYNEAKGKQKPSEYKNMIFSLAVSWLDHKGNVSIEIFNHFQEFFEVVLSVLGGRKTAPTIILNAHNTNKYDNHFLRHDLIYFNPDIEKQDMYLTTATTDETNKDSMKMKDVSNDLKKKGILLEKRIKSSINLELAFYLNYVRFETTDNWIKTNSSIATLGKKLLKINAVTKDQLKTSMDYTKYNLDYDMTEEQAREYSKAIFMQLDQGEITYIENDVILLAKSVFHYEELFKDFDYNKRTFTSNILTAYNNNPLSSIQLLNKVGEKKEQRYLKYTDYQFSNVNFYDYLKNFFRGGLNFYNQFQMGKIIKDVFSMDINSSYPFAMHNKKIPTFLKDHDEFEDETNVKIVYDNDDEFTLYQMSRIAFDALILPKIDSIIIKQMLVKYYTTNATMNINSYTFKMIRDITGVTFDELPVFSYATFECMYFGSRKDIERFYKIKTQGKQKNKVVFNSMYDIQITDELNPDEPFSEEEIYISKVYLNGIFGVPALRPFFNVFRHDKKGELFNVENGHKNTERNIVFSIFVTAVSLWNLLSPLKYLTSEEIDEHFLYCDTDSLYFSKKIQNKIPQNLFDPFALGKWDLEHDHIKEFYVLNHKKYAYLDESENIIVRSGGIPHDSFDRDMSFKEFIDSQFSDGAIVKTLKSIYNNQGTISIYNSETELEIGKGYRLTARSPFYDRMLERIREEIKQEVVNVSNDAMYVETPIGSFSVSDFFPYENEVRNKQPLIYLQLEQKQMRKQMNEIFEEM